MKIEIKKKSQDLLAQSIRTYHRKSREKKIKCTK